MVSDSLRRVARQLPTRDPGGNAPFICPRLEGVDDEALAYLRKLGMGDTEYEFGFEDGWRGLRFSLDQQRQRKAWLLFAADLWDEGVAR